MLNNLENEKKKELISHHVTVMWNSIRIHSENRIGTSTYLYNKLRGLANCPVLKSR